MAVYKAPKNFGGISTDGKTYKADKKGIVTLPDEFSPDLASSHGLIAVGGEVQDDAGSADSSDASETGAAGAQ